LKLLSSNIKMLQKLVAQKERNRLVAGRLLLKLEYPCSWIVLAREHSIGRARISKNTRRYLSSSQDEKNQAIEAARDFYASRTQDYPQFAGIIIT
jgi:hypothetical protein